MMAALRSKTLSLIVPAIVTVAALVLVVAAQLGEGRDATGESQPMPQESPTAEPTVTPTEQVTELDPEELRVTSYEVFLSRDPFEPVHPALAGNPGGGGDGGTASPTTSPTSPGTGPTTGPTTSPTTGPTTSPTASPSPTATPGPGDHGCTQNATVVCDGQSVSVIDVYTDAGGDGAVLQVDDVLYDVRDGDLFAASFRVMSIDAPCVTLLFGDDAFTICEGESVLK